MKRIFSCFLFCFLILACPYQAQAGSTNVQEIFNKTAVTADENGDWFCFDNRAVDWTFEIVATENSGTGTLDVNIRTTSDKSHVSTAIITFTQLSATGSQFKTLSATTFVLRCVRAVIDVGASGSPNYDIAVTAHYRRTL